MCARVRGMTGEAFQKDLFSAFPSSQCFTDEGSNFERRAAPTGLA